jgi:hypothetical protein
MVKKSLRPACANVYWTISKIALLMTCLLSRRTKMANEEVTDFDNGLRILAKMIARAYKKELADKRATLSVTSNGNKESKDANKGIVRNCKIA